MHTEPSSNPGLTGAVRRWLLSLLATPGVYRGRRLLHTTLLATLALHLSAPVLATNNTQYAIHNTPLHQSPIPNPQSPYAIPAVQTALHQLNLPLSPQSSVLSPQSSDEFQVNTYTTSFQFRSAVALDSDGDFVVVWESNGSVGSDTAGRSIQGQRYNSAGSPQGSQFQVNTYTTSNQLFPAVAMDSDGDFVIVWLSFGSYGDDSSGNSIQGQRYNSVGTAQGSQFQVNTYTTNAQRDAAIAMDSDGDFVVVWNSDGSGGSDDQFYSIQGQRYDSAGTPQAGEFQVNTYTTESQRYPAVSMDGDGDFVVVWHSPGDGANNSIQAQRYNSSGTPQSSQFQVNTYTDGSQVFPAVALDSDGDFVVIWQSGGAYSDTDSDSIQGQRYNSTGAPQGSQFQVNTYTTNGQRYPAVAMDSDGDFAVIWHSLGSNSSDTADTGIQARVFRKDSLPLLGEFQVNSYTTSSQRYPAVAIDANGDFVVAWQSSGSDTGSPVDTDNYSVQARRFDLGQLDYQVNTYTTGNQRFPAVALDSDGDFVIVWQSTSAGGDGDGQSIHARLFDNNGLPKGDQFQVNTYTTGSQIRPDVALDSDGDFVIVWQSYGSSGADTDQYSIQAQRYNSAGAPQGSQFQVNTVTTGRQRNPAVALDSDGDFILVWESEASTGSDTNNFSIQQRRFNAGGTPLDAADVQVNTYTTSAQRLPDVAAEAGGDFVIVWASLGSFTTDNNLFSIQRRRFTAAGAPLDANDLQVNTYTENNQFSPAVALDSDGDFVVVWESDNDDSGDSSGHSIQGRRYTNTGAAAGSQFRVNTYTTGDQSYPAVSLDTTGNFVVVWQSNGSSGGDTAGLSVHAQRYNSSGATQANQFQVNTYTTNSQGNPAVSLDSDGDLLIAWESNGLISPPFSNPSEYSEGLENDNDYAIAAGRFTALAGPEPTALTLQSTSLPAPPSPLFFLTALFATLTTLLTAAYLRLRRYHLP